MLVLRVLCGECCAEYGLPTTEKGSVDSEVERCCVCVAPVSVSVCVVVTVVVVAVTSVSSTAVRGVRGGDCGGVTNIRGVVPRGGVTTVRGVVVGGVTTVRGVVVEGV